VRGTHQAVEHVSGQVIGGHAAAVTLFVNGAPRELTLDGDRFDVPLDLQPGLNDVRVVARGHDGAETGDAVAIQFTPATIQLVSPRDGDAVAGDDVPFAVVEGTVGDPATTRVWILVNDLRVLAPVRQGRFRRAVPVLDAVSRVRVQGRDDDATSETVTVRAAPSAPFAAAIVIEGSGEPGAGVELSATWRSRADRLDVPTRAVLLRRFPGGSETPEPDVFVVPDLKPGAYGITLRSSSGTGESMRATLYLRRPGAVSQHALQPGRDGSVAILQTRILLPQAVTWDQDDWFTGRSEGADTITKFRMPEGIAWTERRGGSR
jgi:hypothetical protein